MDLITAIAYIAKSPKETLIFGNLFNQLNENNELEINISKFAKHNSYSRVTVSNMLKRAVECNFAYKIETGTYFINPFILRGSGFKSNANFESIQQKWNSIKAQNKQKK